MTETVLDRTDSLEIRQDSSQRVPEIITDDLLREIASEIEEFPQLPIQIIRKYAEIAARGHGTLKRLPDGGWFAAIPGFEGVWASEPTTEETLDALEETLVEWTILKIQHKDKDLPVLEEIDLNVL